jgi:hypothetical protein
MAIITLSSSLIAEGFAMGVVRNDLEERSDVTGVRAGRALGLPQWRWHIRAPKRMTAAQAAIWKTMLLGLDGLTNHLAAWNLVELAPRGTMRGTMALSAQANAGATSCTIGTGGPGGGQATKTLLAGDWLQIGSALTGQLVMVTADATADANGVISVNFKHPLRYTQASSTSVTWDKALGHYKLMTPDPGWAYDNETLTQGGFDLDFLEQW